MRVVSAGLRSRPLPDRPSRSFARLSSTALREPRANPGIDRRHRRDPFQQHAQIKAGPADQDRQPSACMDIGNLAARHRRPVGCRAGKGAVEHAVQPVLGSRALLAGGSRAQIGRSR